MFVNSFTSYNSIPVTYYHKDFFNKNTFHKIKKYIYIFHKIKVI